MRKISVVFLFLMLMASPVASGQIPSTASESGLKDVEQETAPSQIGDAKPSVMLHLYSGEGEPKLALGLDMLLNDRLSSSMGVRMSSLLRLQKAAREGNLVKPGSYQILKKHTPYLGLRTDADISVFGRVEQDDSQIKIHFTALDASSGVFKESHTSSGKIYEFDALLDDAGKWFGSITGSGKALNSKLDSNDSSYEALIALGEAWDNLYTNANNEALASLLKARNLGLSLDALVREHLLAGLKVEENKGLVSEVNAMLFDLSGDIEKAKSKYEAVLERKPRSKEPLLRLAWMYKHFGQQENLRVVLDKLSQISLFDVEVLYLKGFRLLAQNPALVPDAWKKLADKDIFSPEVLISVAGDQGTPVAKAAAYYKRAGDLYSRGHKPKLANEAYLEAFKRDSSVENIYPIKDALLSDSQVELLAKIVEDSKEKGRAGIMLAQIRLWARQDEVDKAVNSYIALLKKYPDNLALKSEIADYYIKNHLDADNALNVIVGDDKRLSSDFDLLSKLAILYEKAEFAERADFVYRRMIEMRPNSESVKISLIDYYDRDGKSQEAIALLEAMVASDPDCALAWLRLAEISFKAGDKGRYENAANVLKGLDGQAFADFNTKVEEIKKKQKKTIKKAKSIKLDLTFREIADLKKLLPVEESKAVVINADAAGESSFDYVVKLLLKPYSINYSPVEEDLKKLVSSSAVVLNHGPGLGNLDLSIGIQSLTPASFRQFLAAVPANDVYLYTVKRESLPGFDVDNYRVDLYLFTRGSDNIRHHSAVIKYHQEFLESFNAFIFLTPALLLLLIGAIMLKFFMSGFGSLTIRVKYDEHYQKALFGVRMSRKELDSAFNLDKIVSAFHSDLERKRDLEGQVRAKFRSIFPSVREVLDKQADYSYVPVGNYHLYLAGVMVNSSDGSLIGTYEIDRKVEIKKGDDKEIEIDLRLTEVYVGVRVVHESKEKYVEKEKQEDGSIKEISKTRNVKEGVTGATIEVNGDAALTKLSVSGEEVTYYLSYGEYYFSARSGDEMAFAKLIVKDPTPVSLDLVLLPETQARRKAYNDGAMMPSSATTTKLSVIDIEDEYASQESKTTSDSDYNSAINISMDDMLDNDDASSSSSSIAVSPDAIELSDDILRMPEEISMSDVSSSEVDQAEAPKIEELSELGDLLRSDESAQPVDLFNSEEVLSTDEARKRYIEKGLELMVYKRFAEATELFIRAGDFEHATEAAQRSGSQTLHYKIYGINYLQQNKYQEAAEMFKYAEEPLLEADALEGLRLKEEANQKRGEYWRRHGEPAKAIPFFEKAGYWKDAADLHEEEGNHVLAGEAYMKARLYDDAGRNFLASKKIKRAAEAFERAGQFLKAAELYSKVGGKVKVFALYERAGKYCEAAEGYKKFGMMDEAVHACQQVRPESVDFLKASLIMGKIFIERAEHDLARTVYRRVVKNLHQMTIENVELYYEFGVLIQEQGNIHEAKEVFDRIQTVKYNYADVSIRLENLQTEIEEAYSRYGTINPPSTLPAFSGYRTGAATASAGRTDAEILIENNAQTPVPASRYVFEDELGRGAMGIVYKARDSVLDRAVAYKTVSASLAENPSALQYFLSEAKSLAALNHVNVVTIFDVGQDKNGYFITMEYVKGRSLGQFIHDKGRLTSKNCVVIASKVCAGLDYAHNNSVIHRDIKPSNIMISDQGEVKIMDFGLAKIMKEAVEQKTVAKGTPLYMSPEQVEGEGVDHRTDIYSFGVTLFEMITGTLPFTNGDIAYHHMHTAPPRPSEYNPNIPEVLEKIIMRCLEKRKEDRFYSAAEIKQELMPLRNALLAGKL